MFAIAFKDFSRCHARVVFFLITILVLGSVNTSIRFNVDIIILIIDYILISF